MSDEERADRPVETPTGTGARGRAVDEPAWTPPGKVLPDSVLDDVGLPQAVRRGSDPLGGMGTGKRTALPSEPPIGSQPRARRISLPPVSERSAERPIERPEAKPIEDSHVAPGTGARRRPGEVMRRPGAPPAPEPPKGSRKHTPLADAQGVARRRMGVDLPVLGRFGPYEILGRLAMGGMAEILLARRPGAEPLVIKKILAQYARDEDFVEMFLDEARIGSALDHPNIGRFLDFGEVDRQLFIAMEWVHGITLGRLIRRARDKGGLPFPVACEIVARVADALNYAHTARDAEGNVMGLIHRDVSPHNVMIDFDGTVKLLDFGIAKAETQAHHTQAGVVKGKFAYMAPEQCRGKPLDFRIDIFALGVVLFESLIGKSLYRRETEAATMHAIVAEPVPSLLERIPSAPRELEAILSTALQKDPAARFPTAAAMRDVLQQYVARSSEDVGKERIAGLVQHLFRDELEAPLVDSTPFGASYELTGRSAHDDEPQVEGRATLAPPGTGARRAELSRPKAAPAPAIPASPTVAPQSRTASPTPASPTPVSPSATSSPPEGSRLSMDDLFGDAPVAAETAPVAPLDDDPLGLFADLPVPDAPPPPDPSALDIEVEVPEPTRLPAARPSEPTRVPARAEARASRTSEPTRAPTRPRPTPSHARPSQSHTPSHPARLSVTPSHPTSSQSVLEPTTAKADTALWKVLAGLLFAVAVGLGAYALLVRPPTDGPGTLVITTEPPGFLVSLDDGPSRPSPATFGELPPGPHRVEVEGGATPRWEGTVDVAPGSSRTLRIVLE